MWIPTIPYAVWTEMLKGAPAAFVALVIGLVAGGIALNQYRVARAKFRLDLFEKRYEVFEALWTYLSLFGRETEAEQAAEAAMHNAIPKAYFLFGGAIGRYFEEVDKMASQYRTASITMRANAKPQFETELKAKMVESMEFMQGALNGLRERFKPYLGFQKWH